MTCSSKGANGQIRIAFPRPREVSLRSNGVRIQLYVRTMVLCSACYTPFLFGVFVVVKLNTCFLTDLPQIPH